MLFIFITLWTRYGFAFCAFCRLNAQTELLTLKLRRGNMICSAVYWWVFDWNISLPNNTSISKQSGRLEFCEKNIGWQIKGSITLGRVKMIFWWLWIKTQTLHAFSLVCWNIIWWHIFLICFCLLGWYQPFLILQMLGRLEIDMTILMGILDKDIR